MISFLVSSPNVLCLVCLMNRLYLVAFVAICHSVAPPDLVFDDPRDSETVSEEDQPVIQRYIESYSPEFLGNLTVSDREILDAQIAADAVNDMYAPEDEDPSSNEPVDELTPFGVLTLGKRIHAGAQSVLYETIERPDLIIKYQTNCDELDEYVLHPLLLDYWYMLESFRVRLSPEPLFLSPPSLFTRNPRRPRKYRFRMDADEAEFCEEQNGVVRYMIMRKSEGVTLSHFRNRFGDMIVPVAIAAEITIAIVRSLQKLHERTQIVHGDIHPGNILLENTIVPGMIRIQFIDFGRAFRDSRTLSNERVFPIGHWNHFLCSPWQIDGRAWARRDDVYRAIHGFATIINPVEYWTREDAILRFITPHQIIDRKMNRFMFLMTQPRTFDVIINSSFGNTTRRALLTTELVTLQKNVTEGFTDINAPIAYGAITHQLNRVKAIVNQPI